MLPIVNNGLSPQCCYDSRSRPCRGRRVLKKEDLPGEGRKTSRPRATSSRGFGEKAPGSHGRWRGR